jgi:two-component system sensor histidine kinase BaeS
VALLTAAAVALAAPAIVGRGFAAAIAGESPGRGPGAGQGAGAGQGSGGAHWQQVQQETVVTLVVVALAAAGVASLVGFALADRLGRPLARLQTSAEAVARGDLAARSGLGDRGDEIGSLARSFDTMAGELASAEAVRRRFLADVGHELRTPLAVIDATTTAVLDGVYDHDDRHLETIRDQARLLTRIVDDLRTMSLADAGALPLHVETVDVAAVIAGVARDLAMRSPATRVEVDPGVDPSLTVAADPDRLRQVLAAVGDNALRHGAAGTWIRFDARASATAGAVVVSVVDGGPGFPEAALPHVFDRFYQADEARDRAAGTSGLGLAIVRSIVEAHHGSVAATNEPGAGGRIVIELPAGRATA